MNKKGFFKSMTLPVAIAIVGSFLFVSIDVNASDPLPLKISGDLRALVRASNIAQDQPVVGSITNQPGKKHYNASIFQHRNVYSDESGRLLMIIYLDGSVALENIKKWLESNNAQISAIESDYQSGAIEAWMPLNRVTKLAKQAGIGTIVLERKPLEKSFKNNDLQVASKIISTATSAALLKNIGAVTSQGVMLHKADRVPSAIQGQGVSVGVISSSYDTNSEALTRAADDVRSGDLPGKGNPLGNTTPVSVLYEFPGYDSPNDEGRGMLQIVHDIVPKAKLGFHAVGGTGPLSKARAIRALAGLVGAPGSSPSFQANIIVDDYPTTNQPFYSDGLIANVIDEITAMGVTYVVSAGNDSSYTAFESKLDILPTDSAAITASGLKFDQVPRRYWRGGVHNFGSGEKPDIVQAITPTFFDEGTGRYLAEMKLTWDDPFVQTIPKVIKQLKKNTKKMLPEDTVVIEFNAKAGDAIGVSVTSPDLTAFAGYSVVTPSGDIAARKESFVEELKDNFVFLAPKTGTYSLELLLVGNRGGNSTITTAINQVEAKPLVSTDLNILVFDSKGNYLGSVAEFEQVEDSFSTNRPEESAFATTGKEGEAIQIVIARSSPRSSGKSASRFRFTAPNSLLKYQKANQRTIEDIAMAAGSISVGAYSAFTPSVPRSYSQGPVKVYFDKQSQRLDKPQIRQKPEVSGVDGVNTTFFGSSGDTLRDIDSFPNFYGTSAAAPHVGGIAALVIQALGGPSKATPAKVRQILIDSASIPVDLDPHRSVAIIKDADGEQIYLRAADDETGVESRKGNALLVRHDGKTALRSLIFNPKGSVAGAGNPTMLNGTFPEGSQRAGLVWDIADEEFPFVGPRRLRGISAADISTRASNPAPLPADPRRHFMTFTVDFRKGSFAPGDKFSFGIDRDVLDLPGTETTGRGISADLFGQGYSIHQDKIMAGGMRVQAVFENGKVIEGVFQNKIAIGYSPQVGAGLVNAEKAVRLAMQR